MRPTLDIIVTLAMGAKSKRPHRYLMSQGWWAKSRTRHTLETTVPFPLVLEVLGSAEPSTMPFGQSEPPLTCEVAKGHESSSLQ